MDTTMTTSTTFNPAPSSSTSLIPGRESVAEYIDRHIRMSGKTGNQIAQECGFPHSNVVSMIRRGHTKLPIARVKLMAVALGVPTREFAEFVLREYQSDSWTLIADVFLDDR